MIEGQENLKLARQHIDELDKSIAKLLLERLQLAQQIGQLKSQLELPLHDILRESEVLTNISKSVTNGQYKLSIEKIYIAILAESLKVQIAGCDKEISAHDSLQHELVSN